MSKMELIQGLVAGAAGAIGFVLIGKLFDWIRRNKR